MRTKNRLVAWVVTGILVFGLLLIPLASQGLPVKAAVTWTKYSDEVTLDGQRYVIDAWVIKDGSTYEMWYTHATSDLSITEIIASIKTLDLDEIITAITNLDPDALLDNLIDLSVDTIADLLDGTSTVIGYATSSNGKAWRVENAQVLPATSGGAWDSVGAPCVIKDDSTYKMWYTRVETDLTRTNLEAIRDGLGGTPEERKTAIYDLLESISTSINYATSADGINWGAGQTALSGNGDAWNSVGAPCVIKDDSTYKMWYTRVKTDIIETDLDTILADVTLDIHDLLDILDGTTTVIGYATSTDGGVTWTKVNAQVLPATSGGAWDSVADPSVVKTGSTYEMWYTNSKTNLGQADLPTLLDEVMGLGITALWTTLNDEGLVEFMNELITLNISTIKDALSGTSTVIGYATSSNGITWTVQNEQHLAGSSGSPWSSVAAPSVVKTAIAYEMWYTEGIADITLQNLFDLVLGGDLPIGYASYTTTVIFGEPPAPRAPAAAPPEEPGVTDVSEFVTEEGVFTVEVTVESEDGKLEITIEEDTVGLTEEGKAISEITVAEMEEPPPPPAESNIVGLTYDLGPDGATFDPPIALTFEYDESLLPEGAVEGDLVIAMWDEDAGEWVELESVVDPETNTITVSVSHFTPFTIITKPPVPAPTPPVPPAPPAPAAFAVSNLTVSPTDAEPEEPVTITVSVANTGGSEGSYTVAIKINGLKEAEKTVTVAAGSSKVVTFSVTKAKAGSYRVEVNGLSASFTVAAPPEEIPEEIPEVVPEEAMAWWVWLIVGLAVAAVAVIGVFVWLVVRRRRV